MSKMKKVLLMCTAYALVAVIAIGGTLAYLTDRDSKVNTFTVGDVAIDLTEEFEQGAELIPGVKIDKNAEITNIGDNDAWVWMTVLLPKELGPYTAPDNLSAANNVVHWNLPKENVENITVQFEETPVSIDPDGDGTANEFYRTSLLYKNILSPDEATGIMLSTVYMDTHIDIAPDGDWYWVKDGNTTKLDWNTETNGLPKLYVSAYAIQADKFADVKSAYDAYNKQWGDNGAEYNSSTAVVRTLEELNAALEKGGNIVLGNDIEITENATSIVIPEDKNVTLKLNGNTLTNPVSGNAAIANYGTLTITGDGAIVNGVSDTKASNTVHNYGTLTINGGNIGTFASSGAAVRNDGTAAINGGNFASRQESNDQYGQGPAAYCLVNNSGTMTINNATVNGPTHGIFAANSGELIVNGGNYTLIGNDGMGCYVAYAYDTAKITLNGGTVYTYEPRHNRVYYAYTGGKNYFNADAVNTGMIVENGIKVYLNAQTVMIDGNDKAAVVAAINSANDGDTVKLTEDTLIAGYNSDYKLIIDKAIVLDLNGKTLTTECGWGGIDAKGGCSIINGTINHTGNTAAIKAFQVEAIENVTINVSQTANKTKGGIVIQDSADNYVGSIKNVTISGATNGIECYKSISTLAIGSMDNVKINATANGIYLNGAGKIGKISNCEISGGNIGINAYLANLWHISLDIENSSITGGTTGIDIWDEAKTNTGSTVTFDYDDNSIFEGSREDIKVTLQEEITCTINGASQTTPCDVRIK